MSGGILAHPEDRVLTLTIDRPDKKNAFTVAMYRALVDRLAEASADDAVRAVLLRGAGDAFTSGNDVGDFIHDPPQDRDHPVLRFLHRLVDFEKPLVAAVHGPAVGIGTTLLLHCDLVVAARDARFRMPFVPMGLVPEGGSSLLLPRMASPQLAAELLLVGDFFSAERAAAIGLVNELVDDAESAGGRALELARTLAGRPPEAIRQAKSLLRTATRAELHAVIDAEAAEFAARLTSPEALEAMTAFMEKRPPKF